MITKFVKLVIKKHFQLSNLAQKAIGIDRQKISYDFMDSLIPEEL